MHIYLQHLFNQQPHHHERGTDLLVMMAVQFRSKPPAQFREHNTQFLAT
jgi:hypothetical protein